jgi:hypothetical protein
VVRREVITQYPEINPDGTCSRCGAEVLQAGEIKKLLSPTYQGTIKTERCSCPQGAYRGSEVVNDD